MSTVSDDTEAPLLPTSEKFDDAEYRPQPGRRPGCFSSLLVPCLLMLSLAANLLLGGYISLAKAPAASRDTIVPFTGATTEIPFPPESDYGTITNLTRTDELWDSLALYVNRGFVALPKDQAGLPPSDPFPWDEGKAVFVLNSFHLLHCLNIIYTSFRSLQQGELAHAMWAHTVHCLDALRQEVLCGADDTPYVLNGKLIEDNTASGITQMRQCRAWSELEQFAAQNSACFHNYADDDPRHLTIDEWVHCPPDSPYRAVAQAYQAQQEADARSSSSDDVSPAAH